MDASRARVLRAKLLPPALPGSVLVRQRLVDRLATLLDPDGDARLGLVTGPAGFGKTTLLSKFATHAEKSGVRLAWCSLDHRDADTFRFWSCVLAALSVADAGLSASLAGVPAPRRAGNEDFVTTLLEAVDDRPSVLVLVLENVHEIADQGVLRDLDHLLSRASTGLRILLSSRSDPPLVALQAAKVSCRLTQLRVHDLAFTEDETVTWCRDLEVEQRRAVWSRTEGWPAMVRLMEIAMRSGAVDVEGTPWDTGLADYLFTEIMRRQPETAQQGLMRLAVPHTIPLDLAVELSGLTDAGHLLELVCQSTGLISLVAQPGPTAPTYRMHPMLRAYLHGELTRRDIVAERLAQRQSARWCLAAGFGLDALRHSTAVADPAFQESVVRAVGPGLVNDGEGALLLAALDQPGRRRGEESVWTTVIRAAALLDCGRLAEAAVALQGLGPVEGDQDADLVLAHRATEAHLLRRRGSFLAVPPDTGEASGAEDPDLRLMLAVQRGSAWVWQGDLDAGEAELLRGIEIARGLGREAALIDCLGVLGGLHSSRSRFDAMVVVAQEAIDLGEAHGWADTPRMAYPHILRGWSAYQDLDDDLARAHAHLAEAAVEKTADPTVLASVAALNAALSYDSPATVVAGQQADDATAMHDLVVGLPGREVNPALVVYAALGDVRMSIEMQRLPRVHEVTSLLRARFGSCGDADLIEAILAEATGRRAEARALLAGLTRGPQRLVVPLVEAEALVLAATLAHADHDAFVATDLARRALDVAARLHGLRPLVDSYAGFQDLLREGVGRWGRHEPLVARVLDYAGSPTTVSSIALTARQLEVLRELPSLHTVEEIAAMLYVSVNTVKTHLRSLYRKLGVTSRRDAVAEARRLSLL
ncbi:LuxR family transcriptional regulator, maltose regulon positive regulatory protein [Nocardioides alpinus]|uniref:LuxR family transcriptional regulator, maltose regulon positive regulatory protein n=1 Tax=Nocardioides alpinus TaxID=748909 RepID=A0A1I1AWE8_9ACTN|nr:AAA family ATPase [Nocardioides alpinus]SFB42381.1 LuxR family transcriptional regulator, maltose regulon positive regulatory protein [Nocardioides alpinus]